MTQKEQARLQVLNSLLAEHMTLNQAATLMGVSPRHTRRILAAYREKGVAAVAHGHRGRRPGNATPDAVVAGVVRLARTRYAGMNPTKPQFLIDTILIPKRTRLPSRKQAIKRTKSTRRRNPTQKSQKKPAHAPKPTPARKRQERKEQGLCRCGQAAIQGQTRCAECAVKHREWTRQDSENRRRAKGIKPRPRFDDAELIEQI